MIIADCSPYPRRYRYPDWERAHATYTVPYCGARPIWWLDNAASGLYATEEALRAKGFQLMGNDREGASDVAG